MHVKVFVMLLYRDFGGVRLVSLESKMNENSFYAVIIRGYLIIFSLKQQEF